MSEIIPVMKPVIPIVSAVAPYLERMDRNRWYSNWGPLTRDLEERYAAWLGVEPWQVISVANCTLGISAALATTAVERWIAPAYSFAATWQAALFAGRSLQIHDVDLESGMLSTSLPQEAGAMEVGAIIVLPFGRPYSSDLLPGFKDAHVVVDAAASLGSAHGLLSDLNPQWAVAFSLHATKVLPAGGEGGLVVVANERWAERIRSWCNFGFAGSRTPIMPGVNAKMSEVSAAYALASLDDVEKELREWQALRSITIEASRAVGMNQRQVNETRFANPYWIIQCNDREEAFAVRSAAAAAGIETRQWWISASRVNFLAPRDSCQLWPVSEHLEATTVGLPFFRGLGVSDVRRICQVVTSATRT